MTSSLPELERLETGIDHFDDSIEGGIPVRSTTVIAGVSGTGPTAFCLQVAFHSARAGRKCLYFTTLSDPAPKLIRHVRPYGDIRAMTLDARGMHVRAPIHGLALGDGGGGDGDVEGA